MLLVGSAVFLTPLGWMVLTSLKPTEQIFLFPPEFIPKPVEWDNYAEAWSQGEFWTYTQNSTLVAALNIAGNIFGSSLPAFAFARLRFVGRRVLFLIMLSTMMVPIWVTIVPTFLLFKFFGWNGTLLPLIVPGFFAVPFYTFLLRQYFLGISHELEDAARMDGANSLTIYFRIVLPLGATCAGDGGHFRLRLPLERPDHTAHLSDGREALYGGSGLVALSQLLPHGNEPHDGRSHLRAGARVDYLFLHAASVHSRHRAVRKQRLVAFAAGNLFRIPNHFGIWRKPWSARITQSSPTR